MISKNWIVWEKWISNSISIKLNTKKLFFIIVIFALICYWVIRPIYYLSEIRNKILAYQVFSYLENRDADSLSVLFCNEVKSSSDFDEKLNDIINYIDGDFTDEAWSIIKSTHADGDAIGWNYGMVTERGWMTSYDNIETTVGKSYQITIIWYLVNNDYPDNVGIYALNIRHMSDSLGSRVGFI